MPPAGYFAFFFFVLVSIVALAFVLVSVCILGVVDISRKSPLPLVDDNGGLDREEEVTGFLSCLTGGRFVVKYIAGVYYILTNPSCPLTDEMILESLTSRFPSFVFGVRRTLPDVEAANR
jgi:hypothetical protein